MEESANLTASLPEELIVQILLRLPVSSLVRFKRVCKSWRSLICRSQFAKSHFDLAASPCNRGLNWNIHKHLYDLVDSCNLSDESVVTSPLPAPPPVPCTIVTEFWGSCRGFVLLNYDYTPVKNCRRPFFIDLVIWNPSTGEHKRVPHVATRRIGFIYGFGYDESTDDYLIVNINCENGAITHIMLFSVKTNSWNYLQDPYEEKELHKGKYFRLNKPGLLLNGALHWSASSLSESVVVAFDLGQRSLSEIPLPPDRAYGVNIDLYIIGGCLGLSGWFSERIELWVMKEYKVLSSWTRLFSSPLCIHLAEEFESNLFPPRLDEISDKTFESNFCCLSLQEQSLGEIYGNNCRRSETRNTEGQINRQGLCEPLPSCGGGLMLFGESLWRAMYRESLLSLPSETSQDHQP